MNRAHKGRSSSRYADPCYPLHSKGAQSSNKARQQTPGERLQSWAMELMSSVIMEALAPPWVIRGQVAIGIWQGRTWAPARPSSFVALGNTRYSSGIVWKLGTKAYPCSYMIDLAIGFNPSNQGAFKTEEEAVLPLVWSKCWALSLTVNQNWLP